MISESHRAAIITAQKERRAKELKVCDCGKPAIPKRKPGGFRCEVCEKIERDLYARKGLLGEVVRVRSHFSERLRHES